MTNLFLEYIHSSAERAEILRDQRLGSEHCLRRGLLVTMIPLVGCVTLPRDWDYFAKRVYIALAGRIR